MSFHDHHIGNGAGQAVRSEINQINFALTSHNSRASAPGNPVLGQLWLKTDPTDNTYAPILYMRTGVAGETHHYDPITGGFLGTTSNTNSFAYDPGTDWTVIGRMESQTDGISPVFPISPSGVETYGPTSTSPAKVPVMTFTDGVMSVAEVSFDNEVNLPTSTSNYTVATTGFHSTTVFYNATTPGTITCPLLTGRPRGTRVTVIYNRAAASIPTFDWGSTAAQFFPVSGTQPIADVQGIAFGIWNGSNWIVTYGC
jgi:hypothetical protein